MKKLFIILFTLYASHFAFEESGAQWQWQNPKPQGNTLTAMSFVDANTGWAVGTGGFYGSAVIMHTTDGGMTWEAQDSGAEYALHDVCFIDGNNGWAVGTQTTILKTTDGGNTWTSNYDAPRLPSALTGVCFVDAQTGWAVGWAAAASGGPVIWHTDDGGETWDYQVYNSTFLMGKHSVCFIDSLKGWIAWGNKIIHTMDGGSTWEDQVTNTQNNLQNIFFIDSNYGWAVGESGTVFFTTNGGELWDTSTDTVLVGTILSGVSFIDSYTGWAAGYYDDDLMNGVIFKTTDGGLSWEKQLINPDTKALLCLTFENGCGGFAAGNQGEMLKAVNNGEDWYEIYSNISGCDFTDVFFTDDENGWAVGGLGEGDTLIPKVFHTENGGSTWTEQLFPFMENQPLSKVFFVDDQHGWAMGGGIFTTTDGGENWAYQSEDEIISDIYFLDPFIGWRVGANGTLQKTEDGGWTWTDQASGTGRDLSSIFFIDDVNGWIAGDSIILNTSDGGGQWTLQLEGEFSWSDIHFTDEQQGWVTGERYSILGGMGRTMYTTDGGNTWQEIEGQGGGFENIYFTDPDNGWGDRRSFGPGGFWNFYGVWSTHDGGVSWEMEDLYGLRGLGGFCFIDDGTGWVVGENGTILHMDNGGMVGEPESPLIIQNSELKINNYPNPTSGISHFAIYISQYQYVTCKIYDVHGREVAMVLDEKLPAGEHVVQYDLSGLPVGVYVVRLVAGAEVATRKILKVQ
jgi:photosystem II stability/assembly factor-like uncharacterized protein